MFFQFQLLVTCPSTVPTPTVARSVRASNRGVTYHLNHNPKCRTVTPYYHLKFQTGLSNKFQTPTAKKQRTLDTNSPFPPLPSLRTKHTWKKRGVSLPHRTMNKFLVLRVPHSWTPLNRSISSQLMKKMNSKSTYPSCPWMLNPWTTSSLVTTLGRNQTRSHLRQATLLPQIPLMLICVTSTSITP